MNRILIVDDKEDTLYFLQKLLGGHGYTVDATRNGSEALLKARESAPDLVISDLLMPVMDGYTLLRHWKADELLRQIPFVVYTATYTDPRDEQVALDLGADAFILKPTEPGLFITRIRAVLGAERASALTPTKQPVGEETTRLKEYSEVLVHKLEEKALQLQQANRALETDIAQRKRAEGLLRELNRVSSVLSHVNQTIVREKDSQAMLEAICRIAVEKGKFRMAWIGLFNATTRELEPVAASGVVEGYTALVRMNLRDPTKAAGPGARNLLAGEHVVCNDIEHDPVYLPWREEALRRGYRSAGDFPLKVEGQLAGSFSLYADTPGFFDAEEMQLLDELAADVSFALEVGRREKERRQAEDELRWRTAFFEAQVDSAPDGILVVDSQGRKILQNQRMNEIWSIPPHIAEDKDDARQVEFVSAQTKYPEQFTSKVRHLNSHPDEVSRDEIELADGRTLDRYASPVRDKAGKYYGRIWTFRDITERKRSEESVARLATAVEQSVETILITDTQGLIVYTNPAFEKTTGYTCAEALGQNPRILKSDKQDADFYRRMWEVLGRGEIWSGHFVNRRKDGVLIEEEATISPVRDAAGKVVNYVAVKRDVTREVQLEAQFRQSQKMEAIGHLAGGVAHDFNNMLAAMMMQAELTAMTENLPEEARQGLREIRVTAEHAATLTRQLLAFSRRQVLQIRQVNLNEIVTSLTRMLQRTLGKDVRLLLNLHPHGLFTRADPGMLDQVLLNLVINARDAMPEGGQLTIETGERVFTEVEACALTDTVPGRYVCLRVTDTGTGIAPENLSRIFEPFFTTKAPGKGTGLGLATVFGIVKQHEGSVALESELGRGTTFRIFLPATEEAVEPAEAPVAKPKPRGGAETIMLVDDEPGVRMLMRHLLEKNGYQVLEAAHGVESLRLWERHSGPIHLLLTDIVMPEGIGGRELAARLLERNPQLRVIFMSGYSAEIAGRELILREGQNFLQKPSSSDQILETVRKSLDG